jgi:hypothetical protein
MTPVPLAYYVDGREEKGEAFWQIDFFCGRRALAAVLAQVRL